MGQIRFVKRFLIRYFIFNLLNYFCKASLCGCKRFHQNVRKGIIIKLNGLNFHIPNMDICVINIITPPVIPFVMVSTYIVLNLYDYDKMID